MRDYYLRRIFYPPTMNAFIPSLKYNEKGVEWKVSFEDSQAAFLVIGMSALYQNMKEVMEEGMEAFVQKSFPEGLTFDDVLLRPGHSRVMPGDASIGSRLTRSIHVNLPIISAAMD